MTDDSRWKPTMNLRFQKRLVPAGPNTVREALILQQQWQWDSEPLYVEKEATEWRDVPTHDVLATASDGSPAEIPPGPQLDRLIKMGTKRGWKSD